MAILNIPYNQPPASTIGQLFNSANAPAIAKAEKGLETQASTIVTLSIQGQKLSQASNTQTAQSQNTTSKTAAEQSGSAQSSQSGTTQTAQSQRNQSQSAPIQNTQSQNVQSQSAQPQSTQAQSAQARNNQSLTDPNNPNSASQTNAGTQANSIDSYAKEATEPAAREATETAGIQRQEGESKGRNIDVYV